MKKIIHLILICFLFSFLSANFVLAADITKDCPGVCKTGTPGNQAVCDPATESELGYGWKNCAASYQNCCAPKTPGGGTTNTNNSGFGFDKVGGVAKDAGYSPNEQTIDQRISSIISIFLSLLGVLFMILMIYGGYTWMTAAGDEQKVDKAKDIIRAAVIGLIVVIAAYALSVFIISRIWGTTAT